MTQDPHLIPIPPTEMGNDYIVPDLEVYPEWVCLPCGLIHGKAHKVQTTACWNHQPCGVCGAVTACTPPADFGELKVLINGQEIL